VVTIQRALEELDGVHKAVVNFATAKAFVEFDPARVTLDDMAQAIKKAGYTVGGATIRLGIEGLHCASCVGFVEEALRATQRRTQVGTGDRSAKVRTYNFPQNRVTDHRIGLTLHKLESILNGELDPLVEALRLAGARERLEGDPDR
jgi:copper chaperone CopZ